MEKGIELAKKASNNAYAPYSKFKVGACIELVNGEYILGANVENASYGLTCCAERNALFQLYNRGFKKNDIKALYIYGPTLKPISPCGACRQVIYELCPHNIDIYLIASDLSYKQTKIKELLPYGFLLADE